MALRKTERLMNLLFTLMSTRQFLTRAHIKEALEDYRHLGDQAFERKFERDKEDLREMGVLIESGSHDPFGPDDGYRVDKTLIELPDIAMTPEESAVTALAAEVWQNTAMSRTVTTGLAKLRAVGVGVDSFELPLVPTRLATPDDSFDTVVAASRQRREISFDYEDARGSVSTRHLQPWGVMNWQGFWYVGGFDCDRGEPRLFRLSRVISKPRLRTDPGSFEVPEGVTVRQIATLMLGDGGEEQAIIEVRTDRCQQLRRLASTSTTIDSEWDRLTIPFHQAEHLAGLVASHGPDARVTSPEHLRDSVIAHLRAVLA